MDRKDLVPLISGIWTLLLGTLCLNIYYFSDQEKYLAYFATLYSYIRPLNALLVLHAVIQYSSIDLRNGIRFLSKIVLFGIMLITASIPLTQTAETICANYIYLFDNLFFTLGLSIFISCILVTALITMPNMLSSVFCATTIVFIYAYWKISTEVYFPVDEAGFFEMLFSGAASMIELLYVLLTYKIVLLYLKKDSDEFSKPIYFTTILAVIWIFIAHIRFDIYSADFLVSIWHHASYIKCLLIFLVVCSTIYQISKPEHKDRAIILYPVILLAFCFTADFILTGGDLIVGFCHRHGLHSVSAIIMILVYTAIPSSNNLSKIIPWQIRAYALGSMLYTASYLEIFGSMVEHARLLSLILITIGMLLFLTISIKNILQICKPGKKREII